MLKDQIYQAVDDNVVGSSRGAIATGSLRLDASLTACPSQTQVGSYGGNGNMVGTWGAHLPNVNAEGLENFSYGMHNVSASLPFHDYGYSPQMAQRSYASCSTPSPAANCHGQLYDVAELASLDAPYYQHLNSLNNPNITAQTSVSSARVPLTINMQGDGSRFGSHSSYFPTMESFGSGRNFIGDVGRFKYLQQGSDAVESSKLWSDWSKPVHRNGSLVHLSSTTAGPKPINSLGVPANHFGTASQQKDTFFGYGSRLSSYEGHSQSQSNQIAAYNALSSLFGANGQIWPTLHEARQGRRCTDLSCSCNAALDSLSERNRGPRAFKPRSQIMANGSSIDSHSTAVSDVYTKSYNCLDFVTDYKDAKFYVIKSYSEDNVHKSIKYGVWASTPNGNKKLDAAYHEAKEKHVTCPVFLLFSVNASAQFCGVAEMVGPVDFDRSVDYWQQDKWSGQFPVKWRIIKDVPNSQFRHIVLENNDNKPVTNSRDTQEVEMEHGVEILKIFKNYENHSSILDDFYFYEERQKAMQAKKSRQQAARVTAPLAGDSDRVSASNSSDIMTKMSKSFAEAVSLTENRGNFSIPHLATSNKG